jgi:hypothetical protein
VRSLYQTDYYRWAMETAAALREGRIEDVDLQAAAEEIEDLAKSERRNLQSAVSELFLHLLKTKHQPNLAGASWQISIEKQRVKIADTIEENPSLEPLLSDPVFLNRAYRSAVLDAMQETGLSKAAFPAACPFGPDEMTADE